MTATAYWILEPNDVIAIVLALRKEKSYFLCMENICLSATLYEAF